MLQEETEVKSGTASWGVEGWGEDEEGMQNKYHRKLNSDSGNHRKQNS